MLKGIFSGMSTYGDAFRVLSQYNMWSKTILPGVISLGVGAALFIGMGTAATYLVDSFFGIFCDGWLQTDWGCEAATSMQDSWVGAILGFLLSLILVFFLFKYIVSIVLSPFLSMISEEVEHRLTGSPAPKVSLAEAIKDIVRGLRLAIRNILREIFWIIVLNILGLIIPGVGSLLSTAGIFVYQSYFAGFGNLDYILERKRYSVSQSVQYIRRHKGMAIGNGAPFLLISLVPVAGWFLAPVLGATAATLVFLDDEKAKNRYRA